MHHLIFGFGLEFIEHDYVHETSLSLTSKCQISPERRVFDLESEVMRGSIPAGGNILSLDLFLFFTQ